MFSNRKLYLFLGTSFEWPRIPTFSLSINQQRNFYIKTVIAKFEIAFEQTHQILVPGTGLCFFMLSR